MKWFVGDRFEVKPTTITFVGSGSRTWTGHRQRICLEGGEQGVIVGIENTNLRVLFDGFKFNDDLPKESQYFTVR